MTDPTIEIKQAQLEVQQSNEHLNQALDRLKYRTDGTIARIQRIRTNIARAANPIELANDTASRHRGFAWATLALTGILSALLARKALRAYESRRVVGASVTYLDDLEESETLSKRTLAAATPETTLPPGF